MRSPFQQLTGFVHAPSQCTHCALLQFTISKTVEQIELKEDGP